MAWVTEGWTTNEPGNINLTVWGGWNNIIRNGNTISGQIGIKFTYPSTTWTSNSIVGSFNGITYFAQNRVGGQGNTNKNLVPIYCSSSLGNGQYNTIETYAWNFSAQVSGNAPGSIPITVSVGWGDWAGTPRSNYTFYVPYPSAPSNVNLYVQKEKINGEYENALLWKTISVPYGDSYNETWTEKGFNSVTFSNNNVIEALNHTIKAKRLLFYLDLCGFLDNENSDTLEKSSVRYGTCSLSFDDGTEEQNNLIDYNKQHRYGTTYICKNISSSIGHTYKGIKEGELEKVIENDTIIRLNFVTNDVFGNCDINKPGDIYVNVNGKYIRAKEVYIKQNDEWIKING